MFYLPERCYFEEITHRFRARNKFGYKYRHNQFYNIQSRGNNHDVFFRYTGINKL